MCTRCEGYGGSVATGCPSLDYVPTALERRHPAIVARKRADSRNTLRDARYQMGACLDCGEPLDDVSLVNGYEVCGGCE